MSKKPTLKPIVAALGASFAISLVDMPMASAVENPFVMTELESGYMLAGNEGNCGGNVQDAAINADSEGNSDHDLDIHTGKDAHGDNDGTAITGPVTTHQEGHSGDNKAATVEPVKAAQEGNCGGRQ